MKAVIMQAGRQKSIVLFNNGKFGIIPTPPNCEIGMVVNVSYNKRKIIALVCAALIIFFGIVCGLYFTPAGFLRITRGGGEDGGEAVAVELTYNQMKYITAIRPLTQTAVVIVLESSVINKKIPQGFDQVIKSLRRSGGQTEKAVHVAIAQNNLEEAKKIERRLLRLLSKNQDDPQNISVVFELYTLELYRKALQEAGQNNRRIGNYMRHWDDD